MGSCQHKLARMFVPKTDKLNRKMVCTACGFKKMIVLGQLIFSSFHILQVEGLKQSLEGGNFNSIKQG